MLKKLLIVVICLVTVCAVLGLNDRLTYEGLEKAVQIVEGEADDITRDIDAFRLLLGIVEVYAPDRDQSELGWTTNEAGSEYKYTVYIGEDGFQVDTSQSLWKVLETNVDVTSPEFQRVWDIARRFTHKPIDDGFTLVAIVHLSFNYLGAFLSSLAFVVGDFIGVAFSVVEAAFYLLGF